MVRNESNNLKLRRVDNKEFLRNLALLDDGGRFPICSPFYDCRSSNSEYNLFVLEDKVIGYIVSSENLTRVTGFAVHQDFRERGYGEKMVEYLKENARKKGKRLIVNSLPETMGFFQKCGLIMKDHDPDSGVWLADE